LLLLLLLLLLLMMMMMMMMVVVVVVMKRPRGERVLTAQTARVDPTGLDRADGAHSRGREQRV
jgi:hypothetical protein